MERERPRPKALGEDEDLLLGEVRCPYCHATLPEGGLVAACEKCNTYHHVSCFAEHRGCSTHGCTSTRAQNMLVGAPQPQDFTRMTCAQCNTAIDGDALVALCSCGRTLDVGCYEAIGPGCGRRSCKRPVSLLPHAHAVGSKLRGRAAGLGLAALGVAAIWAALWQFKGVPQGTEWVAAGVITLMGLAFTWGCLSAWWRARSLERLPPPRPPGGQGERGKADPKKADPER